jgi:hypothetical protein
LKVAKVEENNLKTSDSEGICTLSEDFCREDGINQQFIEKK